MKNLSLFTVLFALALLFGGCASKSAPIQTYTLNPDLRMGHFANAPYGTKTLRVGYPSNIKGKSSSSIFFSYSSYEEGSYQNAIWNSDSSQLLMGMVVRAVEKSGVFGNILDYNSLANTDYLLESEVYDFSHKVRKDLSVAVVTVRFDLINGADNLLVKSKKFSYEIPTKSVNAAGYVEATNEALERLAVDLTRWLANK